MKLCRLFSSLCLCYAGFAVSLLAQEESAPAEAQAPGGRLVGQVFDAHSGNVVPGVSVIVTDTGLTAVTDVGGRFLLPNVPPGTYKVSFLRAGYVFSSASDVEIVAKEITNLDFPLPPTDVEGDLVELEEFVVDSKVIQNSKAGIIARRQRAASVSDAISSDDFSRVGASDAAAAMSKVVGANVVDGKYVVIRGLGDRYSNTLLNGSSLPSADPNKKAVQLDIVPTGLLDSIVTTKSFTPDKPGDFTGGSVNVETKSFPEEFSLNFSLGLKYEDGTTGEPFLSIPGREMDLWGNTKDALPSDVPSTEDFPSRRDPREEDNGAIRNRASLALSQYSLFPETREAERSNSFSVSHGNSLNIKDRRLGYILSFSRNENYAINDDVREEVWTFELGDEFTQKRGYDRIESAHETAWGILGNLAFQINPQHEIAYTYINNNSAADEVDTRFNGFDRDRGIEPGDLEDGRASLVTFGMGYLDRQMQSHQIKGKHLFPFLKDLNIDWNYSRSNTVEDRPGTRSFFAQVNEDGELDYLTNQPDQNLPQMTFRNIDESRDSFQVNLALPIDKIFEDLTLKGGYLTMTSDRVARQRLFKFYRGRTPVMEFEGFYDLASVISQNPDNNSSQQNYPQWEDLSFRDPNNIASYDGHEEIQAGYFMADLSVTERIRLIGGVRYEQTLLEVEALGSTGQLSAIPLTTGQISEGDYLPAAHMVYKFGNEGKMNIRASYGRTLARPTYHEIAPFRTTDFVTVEVYEGNPALERTIIDNFDVRWEWFIGPSELVAVTYFYKDMVQPIVPTIRFNNQLFYSWTNADTGKVSGVEFELRKRIKNLVFSGNFAFIDSEVKADREDLAFATAFEGQPEFIVNADVSYDIPDWGVTANVLFNAVGQNLSFLSLATEPDIFEDTAYTLNFNITKRLLNDKFALKFSAENLLQSERRKFYLGEDRTFRSFTRNRTFGVSISYSY